MAFYLLFYLFLTTGMIAAIKQFCIDNNTNVNMRVGVHTGRVMCGIIGTKRFKVGQRIQIYDFSLNCCKALSYT